MQQRKADGILPTDDPTLDACGHPAFPFDIPPPAAAAKQQSGRSKKQDANGTAADPVKLTLAQWHALVSFWEHSLFVRARYVGILFGFAAVIVGSVSIANDHWTTFHSQYNTTSGLILCCVYIDHKLSNKLPYSIPRYININFYRKYHTVR